MNTQQIQEYIINMATQWQTFPIEFTGGLVSNMSELQQGLQMVGSATVLQNFEPSKEGGYKKVLGYTKYDAAEVPGSGVVKGIKVVDSTSILAVRSDGVYSKVYYGNGSGWTLKATAAAVGSRAIFTSYKLYGSSRTLIVDGVNFPAIYDSSAGTVTYISPPAYAAEIQGASNVIIHKNSAFFSKGTFLYYTAPNTDSDFDPANNAGVFNLGHEITGLKVFRDQLIIFSTNTVTRLSGNTGNDFRLDSITDSIGCIDQHTIQEVGGDIMYLAPDGLRLLSATDRIGDFGLDVASAPIEKDVKRLINSSSSFASLVIREKAQYRIFSYNPSDTISTAKGIVGTKFSDQGSSNISFANLIGIKVYTCDSEYTGSTETVVFANEDGYVYLLENGFSFNGANIEAIYESPYMPVADPRIRKTFYKLVLYLEPRGVLSANVNVKYDFGRSRGYDVIQPPTEVITSTGSGSSSGVIALYGVATYGVNTYGGNVDKVYTIPVIGSGKTIALRIEDNSVNPSFSLDTAVLDYTENDRQ